MIWKETFIPEIPDLYRRMQRLAALDIILCDTDWLRVHHFDSHWNQTVGLATIDNGAGDDLKIVFAPEGVFLKGFDHENSLSPYANDEQAVWPGMYDGFPASLLPLLEDPAIAKEDVTFCLWRETSHNHWHAGELADTAFDIERDSDGGVHFLLGYIPEHLEDFRAWALVYYDLDHLSEAAAIIWNGQPADADTIRQINPERDTAAALQELQSIGYPLAP